MAYEFPSNPSNGDTDVVNGIRYVYNSTDNTWTPEEGAGGGAGQTLAAGEGIIINDDNEIEVDSAVVSLRFRRLTNDSDFDTLKSAYDGNTATTGTFSLKPRTAQEESNLQTFIQVLIPVVDENGDRFRSDGFDTNQIFHIIDTQTDSEWYVRKLTTQGEDSKRTGDIDQQYDIFRARVQNTPDGTSEAANLTNGVPANIDGRVFNSPDPILDTAGTGINETMFYEENTVAVDTEVIATRTYVDDNAGGGDTIYEDTPLALKHIDTGVRTGTATNFTAIASLTNLPENRVYILETVDDSVTQSYQIFFRQADVYDTEAQYARVLEISDGTDTGYFRVINAENNNTGDGASDPDCTVLTVQPTPFQGTFTLDDYESGNSSIDTSTNLNFRAEMSHEPTLYADQFDGGTGITITNVEVSGRNTVRITATGDSAASLTNDNAGTAISISDNVINVVPGDIDLTDLGDVSSGASNTEHRILYQQPTVDGGNWQGVDATEFDLEQITQAQINLLSNANSGVRAQLQDNVLEHTYYANTGLTVDTDTGSASSVGVVYAVDTDVIATRDRTNWIQSLDSDQFAVIHHDRIENSFNHEASGNPDTDEVIIDRTNKRLEFRNADLNLLEIQSATILNLNYNSKFSYYRITDVSIGSTRTIITVDGNQLGVESTDSDLLATDSSIFNLTQSFVTIYADIRDMEDGSVFASTLNGQVGTATTVGGNTYLSYTMAGGTYYREFTSTGENIRVLQSGADATVAGNYTTIASKTY